MTWRLEIDTPDNGRRIHTHLQRLLDQTPALPEEMERTGERISHIRPHGFVSPLAGKLRDLGIRTVQCDGPSASEDGGMVRIQEHYPSGWAGDEIPAAVVRPIEDNLRKLLNAKRDGARAAHLFVWLELGPRTQAPVTVMAAGRPPRRVPDLQGLDVVWVAIHDGHNPPRWGIWHCTADGWEYLKDSTDTAGSGSLVLWDD